MAVAWDSGQVVPLEVDFRYKVGRIQGPARGDADLISLETGRGISDLITKVIPEIRVALRGDSCSPLLDLLRDPTNVSATGIFVPRQLYLCAIQYVNSHASVFLRACARVVTVYN